MTDASVRTTHPQSPRAPLAAGILLILAGLVGLFGAFQLTVDKFRLLENPAAPLGCDVNPFIGCTPVMQSAQASLLGFPNPILGLMGFVAPVAVGVALLAGARFARWFWIVFNLGLLVAWVFIMWLFTQAVFMIGALCPWCMLVWLTTIPLFWIFTIWGLATGSTIDHPSVRRVAKAVLPFSWLLPVINYAVIVLTIIVQFPLLLPTLF
ncbi:vitamin K epoxide reductase family protein [Frigoribacterium sp. 2-23]|uniref:vitamin K epoxide reductase family protein n=1 Tax=Frigoribacterium sp. 2-23 TaxID=3415006 RepID=UPI003C6F87B1